MKKWFKFDWFGSAERKALQDRNRQLQEENERLSDQVGELHIENIIEKNKASQRLFKNLYYSSGNATVVTNRGDVFTKIGVGPDFVNLINACTSEDQIMSLFTTLEVIQHDKITLDTKEERDQVMSGYKIFEKNSDFVVASGDVFLRGVSLAVPTIIAASFVEILERYNEATVPVEQVELEDQYLALKMFWLKLALNPIDQSRTDLLNFCRKNDVRITRNGNLVLYRKIVTVGDANKALVKFISQEYYRVKKWKKSPKNYWVWVDYDGSAKYSLLDKKPTRRKTNGKLEGNLYELYQELPRMQANEYTSWHNKGKHIIKIGGIYKIPDSGINLDNGLCAAGGLHAAAVDYNYSSFGDTPVVVLVNPSKAITVPTGETGKLRTTEMFVACINDKPLGEHFDDSALSSFDEEYNNLTINELEQAISTKSFSPASIVNEVSPINFNDMEAIKNMLKNRIHTI